MPEIDLLDRETLLILFSLKDEMKFDKGYILQIGFRSNLATDINVRIYVYMKRMVNCTSYTLSLLIKTTEGVRLSL